MQLNIANKKDAFHICKLLNLAYRGVDGWTTESALVKGNRCNENDIVADIEEDTVVEEVLVDMVVDIVADMIVDMVVDRRQIVSRVLALKSAKNVERACPSPVRLFRKIRS